MSWLNEELPTDWPSKKSEARNDSSLDFSTSQSGDSLPVDPTVAIQPGTSSTAPQWKQAIQPPKHKQSSHRLTRLFMPPVIPGENAESGADDAHKSTETHDVSESTASSSSHNEEDGPRKHITRRLKVFGRPDTYTNERLGNLLTSMGGANYNSATFEGGEGRSAMDHSANETDGDLADNLQNEGRKVLQGLAPFRPNLSAVQESSLDKLEQQLTSQGTTPQLGSDRSTHLYHPPADTTTSSLSHNDSTSQTLESLPAGLSNWDTIGGTHMNLSPHRIPESSEPRPRPSFAAPKPPLHKHSSRTLIGSGKSRKERASREETQQGYLDPEAEISALGIREIGGDSPPVEEEGLPEPVDMSAEHTIERFSNEFSTTTEQPASTPELESSRDHPPQQLHVPPRKSASRIRFSSQHAYDITPDHMARRYLKFASPQQSVRNGPEHEGHNSIVSHSSSRPVSHAASYLGSRISSPLDNSIVTKDVSFSAGFENLARLIREQSNLEEGMPFDMLDSLDLSDCDLETISGLDKFVPELTTLFLNGNSIRSLNGLPFNLVHLDLAFNRLSNVNTFPVCFVSTLIISNNELRNLEPLANLRALSSLDVSGNKLTSLRGIESLTALRTLNVRDNLLKSLDINLGMLVELDAANNQISAVRLQAPNLESLDLEGNEVVALTEPLPNLRELNIRFNDATVDFQGWQSLETLLFDGNRAVYNFESVAGILVTFSWEQEKRSGKSKQDYKDRVPINLLTSARDLKLAGRESGWPFLKIDTIFSVQHLDLSLSGIRELPRNFPEKFPFLRSLNLSFNKLDSKCIPILASCAKLERLSLFGNRVDVTGEKLARKLPSLRMLDSRSQHRSRGLVSPGEYATALYSSISEVTEQTSLINTSSFELQWLDGKWTNRAANIKPTTRPGFPSALYPESWNPPSPSSRSGANATVDGESTLDTLTAWDMVEAMYVHHYLQASS